MLVAQTVKTSKHFRDLRSAVKDEVEDEDEAKERRKSSRVRKLPSVQLCLSC